MSRATPRTMALTICPVSPPFPRCRNTSGAVSPAASASLNPAGMTTANRMAERSSAGVRVGLRALFHLHLGQRVQPLHQLPRLRPAVQVHHAGGREYLALAAQRTVHQREQQDGQSDAEGQLRPVVQEQLEFDECYVKGTQHREEWMPFLDRNSRESGNPGCLGRDDVTGHKRFWIPAKAGMTARGRNGVSVWD